MALGVLAAPSLAAEAPKSADDPYPQDILPDSAGGNLSLPAARGQVATVLVCMSIECPISNEYTPTLNRLAEKFLPSGVSFIGINPNSGQTLREMADHARQFKIAFPFVKDAGAKVSRRLLFQVTPEVCVFDRGGKLAYRGRIDDRYRARGGAAGAVATADLERALDELIAGKPVSVSRTKAIGCPVQLTSEHTPRSAPAGEVVTYTKHMARIFQDHCQECHRKGGLGPFELTSYEKAVNWADDLREYTANGNMPPWKPVDGFGEFKNRRAMSTEDKALIARWVAQGCPEGNRDDLPEPRVFSDTWKLGTPDLVVAPSEEYHLAADGPDVYRNFVLPVTFDADKYISAVEFIPGNPRVVHHILTFLDDSGMAERLDARDPEPGYSSSQGLPGFVPVGGVAGLGGWAPGNVMGFLPDGMARVLPRGTKIVLQVHYHKNGRSEVDLTRIGLHFAKSKVTRAVTALPLMPVGGPASGMRIPAGATDHEVHGSFLLSTSSLAVNVTPHMHLLGKDMKVTATLPDGKVVPMVYVTNWDFNWQELYTYRELVHLPAGTRLDLVAHYDNSEENPRNPSRPPKVVRWGEETTDEMCIAFIEMVPEQEAANESDLKLPNRGEVIRYLVEGQTGGPSNSDTDAPLKRIADRLFKSRGNKKQDK
jgi:mono/diheme cytochrome c family protein